MLIENCKCLDKRHTCMQAGPCNRYSRLSLIWLKSSYMGHALWKRVFGICGQRRRRSDCASAQSDQGLCCPLTESFDTTEYINREQMPGWDIAHARYELAWKFVHFAHVRKHLFAWRCPCGRGLYLYVKDDSQEQPVYPQSLVKVFAIILENVCRIYRRKMKTDCTAQILRLFLAFGIRIYVSVVLTWYNTINALCLMLEKILWSSRHVKIFYLRQSKTYLAACKTFSMKTGTNVK